MNGSPQSQFPFSTSPIPASSTSTAAGRNTRVTVNETFRAKNAVVAGSAARLVRMPKT